MTTGETTIEGWLERLASKTPTPGGGAAAALSAAVAAGLVGMVTSYTTGPTYADRESRMNELQAEAAKLRADALTLADDDEAAFGAVGAAYGLPKDTDAGKETRRVAIERALIGAAEPPTRTGLVAARLVEIAAELVAASNPNVVSDVAVAASCARSAIESAIVNVEINRGLLRNDTEVARLTEVVATLAAALPAADDVITAVRGRLG